MDDRVTQDALKQWREGLIGLNRRSTLLRFRPPSRSSFTFDSPDANEILTLIRSGKELVLEGDSFGQDYPRARVTSTALHVSRPESELGPIARTLMRKSNEAFLDRGLSVLYVAFGILRWKDADRDEMTSPLYLVPVQLVPTGPQGMPKLKGSDEDPVLNPALPLRLADFGVTLPTIGETDGLDVSAILDLFRSAISGKPDSRDWQLSPEVHLASFSFEKEAMYKDLVDNEAQIAQHPIVQALANTDPTAQTVAFQFDPFDPADIDNTAPPELTPLVLDADSSQRAAVAAAVAGRSFVMDGPPGTGKSQTIANMIGALMHEGKSVLFVSEKIAALDVVRNRLERAGLGSFILELHSHKTSRKDVAIALSTTLDNVAKPPGGISSVSRARLKEQRIRLTDYAAAMNEIRRPLEMSLHDALGKLSDLVESLPAPQPTSVGGLDRAFYDELSQSLLSRLALNWRPALEGRNYLWRDVLEEGSLETRIWTASAALDELRDAMDASREVSNAFGLDRPDRADALVRLLEIREGGRKPIPVSWLTSESMSDVVSAQTELMALLSEYSVAAQEVVNLTGKTFSEFPPLARLNLSRETVDAGLARLDAEHLRSYLIYLEHHVAALPAAVRSVVVLAESAGLETPVTWDDLDRVVRLVIARGSGASVVPSWLSPGGLQEARSVAGQLHEKSVVLAVAEERARTIYKPDALVAPLSELQDRFENLHKGLRKLSGNYRQDKQAVTALLSDASHVKSGIGRLSEAVAWSEAHREFEAAEVRHARLLGKHWAGRETNWHVLDESFALADELMRVSGNVVPNRAVDFFASSSPDTAHVRIAQNARQAFSGWRDSLASTALSGPAELSIGPIDDSIRWLSTRVAEAESALALVESVNKVAEGNFTVTQATNIQASLNGVQRAVGKIDTAAPTFRARLGDLFQGVNTETSTIDSVLADAERVRAFAGGVLTDAQASAFAQARPDPLLSSILAKWESARDAIVEAFSEGRKEDLLLEFGSFRDAAELLRLLGDDPEGQRVWFNYREILQTLEAHGLGETVSFCVQNKVPPEDVPMVIERALLSAWSDAQINEDPRLYPLEWTDRAALVAEFKQLDRKLIDAATGEIIKAVNGRRPGNTTIGEPALIRQQGSRERKHLPVRDLISKARVTVQAIKPVFMMSPLAVSQYLPSNMQFDVVIFDEASQVSPGDAINCIYRGRSLILAGDDKQLPPTRFFERSLDDGEEGDDVSVKDFQSVLELAKAAGAFQNLGLRWHYRSRHESLIAFSNYNFYEGKLITFPSAQDEGPDVGIEFFKADGMYRRGAGANNPKEAQLVAERVIHHYRTRPEASLGVVTFSTNQADAVDAAVRSLRDEHRDLDAYFERSDRLDGFFVRSLESVQGDERDVIIFSVGYGPDEAGKITTNFGVLNKDKGWRRLNVGITRARQRVEVIASMEADDIPFSSNENVEALRGYLDFARRGISVLGTQASMTGLMPESPFEESVIKTVRSWGYSVEPQVGVAGYRIDLAIRHPDKPGVFALGIECDGYQYHSSPAARDRDRLRDQVLAGLGWRLHRIWGTAWYRYRNAEEDRLRDVIKQAISGTLQVSEVASSPIRRDVETVPLKVERSGGWASRYKQARLGSIRGAEPGDTGSYVRMIQPLRALVEAEGPIHMEVIGQRVRDAWWISRVTSRVLTNINRAILEAGLQVEGEFVDVPGRPVASVRSRGNKRDVDQIHLDEFALAVHFLVREVGAVTRTEVVTKIATMYGWSRIGSNIAGRVELAIDRAVAVGTVVDDGERLMIPAPEQVES